jgi:hypothetical protein
MGLFGKTRTSIALMDAEATQVVFFDATMAISYTGTAQITDHPIEKSDEDPDALGVMTDHMQRMPKMLQIRGVVSDFPIELLASFTAESAVLNGDTDARAYDAFAFVESLMNLGGLCVVDTPLLFMENMIITGLACTRDKDSGQIMDMTIDLREIQIAETEKVTIGTDATAPRSKGKRTKKPAPPAVAAKAASLLSRLFGVF